MATTWTPSDEQVRIYEWFAHGSGNLVVRAYAGCGKTSTILEAINHAPETRIMLAAFNKRIAEELTRRLRNPNAEAKTLHAIGFAAVRRWWPDVRVCSPERLRRDHLTNAVCGDGVPDPIKRLVSTLHSKAREIRPLATQPGDLLDLADQFECEPDEEWEAFGYDVSFVERMALLAMELAAKIKPAQTGIDFADMIYLPLRNGWLRPTYDLVVADEGQDLSAAQILTFRRIAAGRIVIVGDPNQNVYLFRGTEHDSINRLKGELNAAELGLKCTYRCGRSIVAKAAQLVTDFVCPPTAHEGEIRHLPTAGHAVLEAIPGDVILSRKNAPLAGVAMALIRAHKRCVITGRDLGAGLITLTDKLAKGNAAHSVPAFLGKLAHWEAREIARAVRALKDDKVDAIRDKAATLAVLSEGVVGVPELRSRLAELFTDTSDPATVVTCSSIHKFKGLEADRVYVLADTLYPKLPKGAKYSAGRAQEERNLDYVASTRAKNVLVLVADSGTLTLPCSLKNAAVNASTLNPSSRSTPNAVTETASAPPAETATSADAIPSYPENSPAPNVTK